MTDIIPGMLRMLRIAWPPPSKTERSRTKNKDALRIHGLRDLLIHYARCCNPIAGDPVVGIVTRGRGISVHRRECSNLTDLASDPGRVVTLDWETDLKETFTVTIQITGNDRTNVLSDITQVMTHLGIPIVGASIKTHREEIDNQFQVEIKNTDQLDSLVQRLRAVSGVTSAYRLDDTSDSMTKSI